MWTFFRHLFSKKIGQDEQGNIYMESRSKDHLGRAYRWVKYAGKRQASAVPASWHAWLHYTVDSPILAAAGDWAKPHEVNQTGTLSAKLPKSHPALGSHRVLQKIQEYTAWTPAVENDTSKS